VRPSASDDALVAQLLFAHGGQVLITHAQRGVHAGDERAISPALMRKLNHMPPRCMREAATGSATASGW
jgi:hypothetical protein